MVNENVNGIAFKDINAILSFQIITACALAVSVTDLEAKNYHHGRDTVESVSQIPIDLCAQFSHVEGDP